MRDPPKSHAPGSACQGCKYRGSLLLWGRLFPVRTYSVLQSGTGSCALAPEHGHVARSRRRRWPGKRGLQVELLQKQHGPTLKGALLELDEPLADIDDAGATSAACNQLLGAARERLGEAQRTADGARRQLLSAQASLRGLEEGMTKVPPDLGLLYSVQATHKRGVKGAVHAAAESALAPCLCARCRSWHGIYLLHYMALGHAGCSRYVGGSAVHVMQFPWVQKQVSRECGASAHAGALQRSAAQVAAPRQEAACAPDAATVHLHASSGLGR